MASYTITINDEVPDFFSLPVNKQDLVTWASGDSAYRISGLAALFENFQGQFTIPAGGQIGPLRIANTASKGKHFYRINERITPDGNPDILVNN